MGLNYVAATQDARTTANRVQWATVCWVARNSGIVSGTICYYTGTQFTIEPAWYQRKEVSNFGQFAVEPELQRAGLGSALLDIVENRARFDGKIELACDTAVAATHLVTFYERGGFRKVGRHQ
jgi:GNAT superfamily N-acetyltransferase